ncbi:MAG: regulatory signaling modulator protein AmpE [Gammaproteobacteria bacterium]|nr:regulatory signaling modulator protein AmpE [Gammaproteobacteria bacterium]
MTLLSILIALLVERLVESLHGWREHSWFLRYYQWMFQHAGNKGFWSGPGGVIVVLVPIVLAVIIVFGILDMILFGFLSFLGAIAVLLLCLGPRDLDADTDNLIRAIEEDDETTVRECTEKLLGSNAEVDNRMIAEGVLAQSLERIFGVIFWFIILGPVGAVLFRAGSLLSATVARSEEEREGFAKAVARLNGILNWLPARLTALGFAVMGNFEDALHNWQIRSAELESDWIDSSKEALVASGMGALRLVSPVEGDDVQASELPISAVRAAMGLVWRTLVVWIVIIALLTLAGLAG